MECMEDGNSLRKRVKNLPFCLEISFGSLGRTTRKGKGSQIDPTSHPEKAKPVLEKVSPPLLVPIFSIWRRNALLQGKMLWECELTVHFRLSVRLD